MVEKYIKGVESTDNEVQYNERSGEVTKKAPLSYFNIVKSNMIVTELINRFNAMEDLQRKSVVSTTQQTKVDFGVNERIFDFFLQRRQMDIL